MLFIVATPIGNLDDISARALQVLKEADVIACEDTRRTRVLLSHFGIPKPAFFISYRQGTEQKTGEYLMRFVDEGRKVVLCSDGGYPGISDPGYRLVSMAAERGIEFQVIPGASAVDVALLASGLSTSSYTFKGYPPRKQGALRRFFEEEKNMPHTLIIFESPFRVEDTLAAAMEVLGDRKAAVCIELTKKFERVSRGFLKQLYQEFTGVKIKGEVTIVIAGNNPKFLNTAPELPVSAN
ncbi:MAG: 16S rRNA (cytidine(1402)-2'-O)-methyltransferase [Kiritimatiellae bacterium]|nr:16S rRNA (cytidine(1402)-2'-O)-methyltransferase [Kiritimatiellia bacterium]MDD5520024.1 16S rRNA (cytidine(1402)-2'-O)-methyltransferase [Kiritimatiellia bacterium]